ncbi:CHAT domain-containing protein [Actinocorallia herbida]|uniref:CHAT domain-containing protein n=1 Tax=Actinocorallia herbida TaxID=58109 RepID=A0A3N1D3M7_9ACTN|nr:CHAT domain-containing protein [Actinocorallia herbida]ROO87658.1 CHAT domain-containing protein [Actinocorallia herbida]
MGSEQRVVIAEFYTTADRVLVFLISPDADEPECATVEIPRQQLREVAEGFQRRLRTTSAADLTDDALVRLMEPVVRWVRPGDMVYLVPHDVLHTLPLQAIEVDGVSLVDRCPVATVPSASVLRYCGFKRKGKRGNALIVAAPPDRRPLVFAREQALTIAQRFAGHDLLLGGEATRAALIERAGSVPRDVLHISSHGVFDSTNPLRSGIELADGRLTAEDILGLGLDVNLVTLAACESGVSLRRHGDELVGLARALLYAGSPSVLVSLWPVDELSTTMLLDRFYERLAKGLGKAHALRDAQLWLRGHTVRDVLAHAAATRSRLSDDDVSACAVHLEEAALLAMVGDYPGAARTYRLVLALAGGTVEQHEAAHLGAVRMDLIGDAADPAFDTLAFADPYHWASFILIGDWL